MRHCCFREEVLVWLLPFLKQVLHHVLAKWGRGSGLCPLGQAGYSSIAGRWWSCIGVVAAVVLLLVGSCIGCFPNFLGSG